MAKGAGEQCVNVSLIVHGRSAMIQELIVLSKLMNTLYKARSVATKLPNRQSIHDHIYFWGGKSIGNIPSSRKDGPANYKPKQKPDSCPLFWCIKLVRCLPAVRPEAPSLCFCSFLVSGRRDRLPRFLRRVACFRCTCPVVSAGRSRLGVSGEKAWFAGQDHRQHQVQLGGHRTKAESLENADSLAESEPWLRLERPGTGALGGGVGTFGRQILPRNGDLNLWLWLSTLVETVRCRPLPLSPTHLIGRK